MSAAIQTQDILNDQVANYFGQYGHALLKNGWSIFPQSQDRRPAMVGGKMIKPMEDHELNLRAPTVAEMDLWVKECSRSNLSCFMGPGSGGAVAVDIDVYNAELSAKVQKIATDVFGPTPLHRVGSQPKVALIYRADTGDHLRNRQIKALNDGHGIDILTHGKSLTFYGIHYSTGRPYTWPEDSPRIIKPSDLPIITENQIDEFLSKTSEIMPFVTRMVGENLQVDIAFTENSEGKIADGRNAWLQEWVYRRAIDWVQNGKASDSQGLSQLSKEIIEDFIKSCVCDGRWAIPNLKNEVTHRVQRIFSNIAKGDIKIRKRNPIRTALPPVREVKPILKGGRRGTLAPDDLDTDHSSHGADAVGNSNGATQLPHPGVAGEDNDALTLQKKNPVKLLTWAEHQDTLSFVTLSMRKAITTFLNECNTKSSHDAPKLYIFKAPPGIGKTTTLTRMLAEDAGTYRDMMIDGKPHRAPYIMLVPTYRNIYELRDKAFIFGLDEKLDDKSLMEMARHEGVLEEGDVKGLEELRQRISRESGPGKEHGGFKVGIYQGRLRAGCAMTEHMQSVMSAGIAGSSLCKREIDDRYREQHDLDATVKELKCDHYETCPAILQSEIFDRVHLVLMPHAFLSLSIPEASKKTRGVIIDERAYSLFLHTTKLSVDVFEYARRGAPLSKKDYAKLKSEDPNFTLRQHENDCLILRQNAATIVLEALRAGLDPAQALIDQIPDDPQKSYDEAIRMLKTIKDMCFASSKRDAEISPNMSLEDIKQVASRPTGVEAMKEWRFWSILHERVQLVFTSQIGQTTMPKGQVLGDARIQYLHPTDTGEEWIRLSWRTEPNWIDTPTLLLDASAAPEIIQKVWKRHPDDVIVEDLVSIAGLHQRIKTILVKDGASSDAEFQTFSNSSLIGVPSDAKRMKRAAEMLNRLKYAIGSISIKHADNRVLVGCNIPIRRVLNETWLAPLNVDFGHFGALRGIDAYKNHAAVVSIGRLEVPVEVIDGIAAALTYDDEVPELPLNRLGTGYLPDGNPAIPPNMPKTYKMRDGGAITIEIPVYPTKWAALVQAQYREEELIQCLGRMRPYHRKDKDISELPVWYSVSSVLPDDAIIDEIVGTKNIINPFGADVIDLARLTGGTMEEIDMPEYYIWDRLSAVDAVEKFHSEIARLKIKNLTNSDGSLIYSRNPERIRDALDDAIGSDEQRLNREVEITRAITLQATGKETLNTTQRTGLTYTKRKQPLSTLINLKILELFHDGASQRIDNILKGVDISEPDENADVKEETYENYF